METKPPPPLVHGHPVVASFFHAIGARSPPASDATSEDAATSPSSPPPATRAKAEAAAGDRRARKRPRGQKHSYLVRRVRLANSINLNPFFQSARG